MTTSVSGGFNEFIVLHSFHSSSESQSSVSLSDLSKMRLVSHPTAPPTPANTALAPADSPAAPEATKQCIDEVK